jgi:uncharacterized repeat protein (TIGR01451 family)
MKKFISVTLALCIVSNSVGYIAYAGATQESDIVIADNSKENMKKEELRAIGDDSEIDRTQSSGDLTGTEESIKQEDDLKNPDVEKPSDKKRETDPEDKRAETSTTSEKSGPEEKQPTLVNEPKKADVGLFAQQPLESYPKNTMMNDKGLPLDGSSIPWPDSVMQLKVPKVIEWYNGTMKLKENSISYLATGNVVLFKNMGIYKGKKVDVRWTFNKVTLRTSVDKVYIQVTTGGAGLWMTKNSEVEFTQTIVDETGAELEVSTLVEPMISTNTTVAYDAAHFERSFSTKKPTPSVINVDETATNVSFINPSPTVKEAVGVLVKNNLQLDINIQNAPVGGGSVFFAPTTTVQYPYSKPNVMGQTNEVDMTAKYTVEQTLPEQSSPAFYPDKYSLDVQVNESLKLTTADLQKIVIKDGEGTDITSNFSLSLGTNHNLLITATNAQLQALGYKIFTINFDLSVDTAFNRLSEYLEGTYLKIPLTVKNNLVSGESTDKATVKVDGIPSGSGIPQIVSKGSSTDDLIPAELVENLKSTKPGDTVSVVGFSERTEFPTVGDTIIYVVIKSKHSGLQVNVPVNVTVIDAIPSGVGIPQTVLVGSSTEDLNPQDVVKDLKSTKPGDTVTVVGFSKITEFSAVGETTVYVVIQSQDSGIRTQVSVPVTVKEGTLTLEKVPASIQFDNLKIQTKPQDYYPVNLGEQLLVKDTRLYKQTWTLQVNIAESIISGDRQHTLDNNLMYKTKEGQEKAISSAAINVESATNTNNEAVNVASQWFNDSTWKGGFFLDIPPGTAMAGSYQGKLEWTLANVPANE